jgi:electron transport complex protein RnfG
MNIRVLKQKETPGLGTRVTEEEFLHQFKDLSKDVFPVSLKKDNGTIDAITAATISSRAFLDALNKAQVGALQAIIQITKKEAP